MDQVIINDQFNNSDIIIDNIANIKKNRNSNKNSCILNKNTLLKYYKISNLSILLNTLLILNQKLVYLI